MTEDLGIYAWAGPFRGDFQGFWSSTEGYPGWYSVQAHVGGGYLIKRGIGIRGDAWTICVSKKSGRVERLGKNGAFVFLTTGRHKNIVVYVIPDFVDIGGLWKVLPPGVHDTTLEEVESRFSTSERRKRLYSGFREGVMALCKAGCRKIFLDGSFVTEKTNPGDFDVCWDPVGVDTAKLDPVFLDFSEGRKKQKEMFKGEFFPAHLYADGKHPFLDFFQIDKYTSLAKGIICIEFQKS